MQFMVNGGEFCTFGFLYKAGQDVDSVNKNTPPDLPSILPPSFPPKLHSKTRFGPNRVAADMEGNGEFDLKVIFWRLF